jgi:hypothetical protein
MVSLKSAGKGKTHSDGAKQRREYREECAAFFVMARFARHCVPCKLNNVRETHQTHLEIDVPVKRDLKLAFGVSATEELTIKIL